MNTFVEIPASKMSLAKRKPICGVGINDSTYITDTIIDGKRMACPYYRKWLGIIQRCYSSKHHERCQTYIDCSVCDEWLLFSNFRRWMVDQDWEGKEIDKDILFPGNKEYHPDKCVFVSSHTNTILCDSGAARGELPIGVSKNGKYYHAKIGKAGKRKYLGNFSTPEEASHAYKIAKRNEITIIANHQCDGRVKDALIRQADLVGGN